MSMHSQIVINIGIKACRGTIYLNIYMHSPLTERFVVEAKETVCDAKIAHERFGLVDPASHRDSETDVLQPLLQRISFPPIGGLDW